MELTSVVAFIAAVGVLTACGPAAAADIIVDKKGVSLTFDGIGGLSGGGATSRLLVDYKEPQRSQILDYLFLPNYGASLHILKVEIGGDSQSTDGTESSHMHSADDLDYHRGYEWWLMVEAKKRNPDIKLYGLAWAYPGWVGNGSGSPFQFPNLTSSYIVKWLEGAKKVYDLDIDYIGIWNERSSSASYVVALRNALNKAGFEKTLIVAKDGGADICNSMAADKAYADAVDVIGLHYPSDFSNFSLCHSFNKPFWASEESSSYDDANGAACWARVINSHWVLQQMTSSIMWNLVGSYYHGTNWYASSMLTAVQPWSGHYWVAPVVWATAHVTQFTKVGWKYLKNGAGSGILANGGYYATLVDPNSNDLTIIIVKISKEHAPCTRPGLPDFNTSAEEVEFMLDSSLGDVRNLQVWHSNFEKGPPYTTFEQKPMIHVVHNRFTLTIEVGDYFTITTLNVGKKGTVDSIPESQPRFPLPYSDSFDNTFESQEAPFFADQIGAFEVHPASVGAAEHKNVMRQMVPQLPIGWSDHGSRGPMTVIGMREWQDLTVTVDFLFPANAPADTAACVATRSDQMWNNGIVFCVDSAGKYNLTTAGPFLISHTSQPVNPTLHNGVLQGFSANSWHQLSLTTIGGKATGSLDSKVLFNNSPVRDIDTGFVAMGTNGWTAVEFDNVRIGEAGTKWSPPAAAACAAPKSGAVLSARNCTRNGLASADQMFLLVPDYSIQHVPSGLCVTAQKIAAGGDLTLQPCSGSSDQTFVNDYTNIRNRLEPMHMQSLVLAGSTKGAVSLQAEHASGVWSYWSYFPNTQQLRNQYTARTQLGYPMCLSACPPTA
ncbi:galactocerebrosidase-like [Sycon ciliatum]|uniref:galactocerebrosidase-like n=1 Tax=Sycon ciliatum TaxID=27933 RepID=UPI0031F6CC25